MQALVGVHKGKSMEELVLKEPAYVHWLLEQTPSGALLAMKNEAKQLIAKFDAKPYVVPCFERCSRPATRLSVYLSNLAPYWWCSDCDPYGQGASDGKLQILRTYVAALSHVQFFCGGKKADYRALIKDMAKAKGLPARVGEAQLKEFFA